MRLKARKINYVPHYRINVSGIEQQEGSVKGVVICSDEEIEVNIESNQIIVKLIDEDSTSSLRTAPEIIAVNANKSLIVTKTVLSETEMAITISGK